MKLTSLLLLACCMQASSKGLSQNVSFSGRNVPIDQAFSAVEQQTDFVFFYDQAILQNTLPVTIKAKQMPLKDFLHAVLKNQPLEYAFQNKTIVISLKSSPGITSYNQSERNPNATPANDKLPPPVEIKGRVIDENGQPLEGASVFVKGTNAGASTDTYGQFSISVPDDSPRILVISFIGKATQEVVVRSKSEVVIRMEPSVQGEQDIIVVGYGAVKKENLTSSVSKITSKDFKYQPITTLSEAFAGRLAGVRVQSASGIPGAELQIRIRGVNSINGNSSPLYVIDGIPRDDMNNISPNDIASIQILKDASGSAIYGSRGANGVVLIETKQGSGKPSFSVETFYGFQENTRKLDMMNKDEYLAYNIWVKNVNWLNQGGSMSDPMSSRPADMQVPDEWVDPAKKGTDWQDAIMVNAPLQSYQMSASAKSDKGSIYLSGGYLNQDGIIYNTYYKRFNFRFNGTLNVSDRIKIGAIIAPSISDADDRNSQGKELVIHHAILEPPIIEINSGTRDWGYPPGLFLNYPNPLQRLKETISNRRENDLSTLVWGQFDILKGLTFKSLLNYDTRKSEYEYFISGNVAFVTQIPAGKSNSVSLTDMGIQNTLTYDKSFKNHTLNVMIGQSVVENKYFGIDVAANGWPNDLVPTLNVASTPTLASTERRKYTGASFFGRTSYSYNDKYLLNASLRFDGSSRFGDKNKWGTFPSLSLGWKINKEPFLYNIGWMNLLKLRVSWGKAGNDRIGNNDYLALLQVSNTTFGNSIINGLTPSSLGNESLKWESTTSFDVGADFSGFNNRLQFSLDFFNNKTDNLLFNVPIPNTTGHSNYRTNIGSVQNTGWEADLTTVNTVGNIRWNTSFNLSRVKNKVTDMGNITQFTEAFWGAQFITQVGAPISQNYVYRTNGLLATDDFDNAGNALVPILPGQVPGNVKYIDQNHDNKINSLDLVPYGNNLPDMTYGMTNSFQWKDLRISFLLQGQIGGDVLFLGQRNFDAGTRITFNQFRRWLHTWKPDYETIYGSGENPIPQIAGVDMSWDGKTPNNFNTKFDDNSDFRIYDATFFRIKNVTLSYNLSENILRKTLFRSVVIYASADNLATFDNNYPGFNVEANNNGLTQAGIDYVTYPLARRYTLGFNITF